MPGARLARCRSPYCANLYFVWLELSKQLFLLEGTPDSGVPQYLCRPTWLFHVEPAWEFQSSLGFMEKLWCTKVVVNLISPSTSSLGTQSP